jgi:ankyrin repeat protein
MVHICDCIPARIRHALDELPETLDETYERTLRGINKANWEFAHRMFQFVSVASRPLYVEELADLLAFDFEEGSIPKFHEDWRLEDPVDAVLSTCSTLLAIVGDDDEGIAVIQFSHFSVKEFLTSTRLAEATDIISRRYHVSMTPAHTRVAQACLGILLHLDKDVTSDSLKDFPLAEYAAEHWADHARFDDVSRNVGDGMKQLFDLSKLHLRICVWICDPTVPTRRRRIRSKTPLPLHQTPLHYAASWDLHPAVEFLIIDRGADVTVENNDGETALHLASQMGQVDAARMLIECGADVTAQYNDGQTSLHLASQRGQVDAARMLIERGADVTAQKNDGQTPLHLATQWGQVDVARMLIEHGADVTAQTNDGETPLHLASQHGRVDVARMLIERGADVTAQNNDGETPLHLASDPQFVPYAPRKFAEIAQMLLEHGADVNAQNKNELTSFVLASEGWHAEIIRVLVQWR